MWPMRRHPLTCLFCLDKVAWDRKHNTFGTECGCQLRRPAGVFFLAGFCATLGVFVRKCKPLTAESAEKKGERAELF